PASYALRVVDDGLLTGIQDDGFLGAVPDAGAAADAGLALDLGLRVRVHLELAPDRARAHAQILEGPAEAGHLMALEVAQGYHDIRIGDGRAYLRALHVLPADLDLSVFGAAKAVGDDDLAGGRQTVEAVLR